MLLTDFFRPLGGVTPKNRRPKAIRNVFKRNRLDEEAAQDVLRELYGMKRCAVSVGLDLTVNNLATLVGVFCSRYEAFQLGEVSLMPPLYKGVSYNPAGKNWREWVLLLDFFAFMHSLVASSCVCRRPPQTAVLDASLYWVVNLLGPEGIQLTSRTTEKAAEELISFLRSTVESRGLDAGVYEIADQRNAYMRAIAEQFPARTTPQVFTVLDVWREPGFASFLATALANFCAFESGRWQVKRAVSYERYMMYSPWVTPLVVAEQTFLADKCGFRLFLAPVEEAAWNSAVDLMSRLTGTPYYATIMYQRPKTADVPYVGFPFFTDSAGQIWDKFRRYPGLEELTSDLVRTFLPFPGDLKAVTETDAAEVISDFCNRIHNRALELYSEGVPNLPLTNMCWLMQFPSGTC